MPAGVWLVQESAPKKTEAPASKTRDTNVPGEVEDPIRTQSTITVPWDTKKSLAAMGRICDVMTTACVATRAPSK